VRAHASLFEDVMPIKQSGCDLEKITAVAFFLGLLTT
jgi:hypothetical protein